MKIYNIVSKQSPLTVAAYILKPVDLTGQESDGETGLDYFGARYLDPGIARFTQVDPIRGSLISPYAYANNNPMKYVDPAGMQGLSSVGGTPGGDKPMSGGVIMLSMEAMAASDLATAKKREEELMGEEKKYQKPEKNDEDESETPDFDTLLESGQLKFENQDLEDAARVAYENDPGFAADVNEALEHYDSIEVIAGEAAQKAPASVHVPTGVITIDPSKVDLSSKMEVAVALAHEISHIHKGHGKKGEHHIAEGEKRAVTASKRTAMAMLNLGYAPGTGIHAGYFGKIIRNELVGMGIFLRGAKLGGFKYNWVNLP